MQSIALNNTLTRGIESKLHHSIKPCKSHNPLKSVGGTCDSVFSLAQMPIPDGILEPPQLSFYFVKLR